MLAKLYQNHVPESLRQKIYNLFLGKFLRIYRYPKDYIKAIRYRWHFFFHKPTSVLEQAMKDWAFYGKLSFYPYSWIGEYEKIYSTNTGEKGLRYVLHEGKKLYMKRSYTTRIQEIYKALLIEQDPRSAHRYVKDYQELKGKVLLDVGCAEGVFALSVIEMVDHAYLFECDQEWIEALEVTFAPWKDKVTIVRKYVSDQTTENSVSLDDFFKDKPTENLFIKMDIEGFERNALAGGNKLLKDNDVKGAICVYHKKDDPVVLQKMAESLGYKSDIEEKYLYNFHEFRLCMMRMEKA